jgi:transcriptional regulator with XRE-family HTH domain
MWIFTLMLNIRLKEERDRLKLTQEVFGTHASAKKRTVVDWESGISSPTAIQMQSLSLIGVDVQYIITGRRSVDVASTLNEAEEKIINTYRRADTEGKTTINYVINLVAKLNNDKIKDDDRNNTGTPTVQANSITQSNVGNNGVIHFGSDAKIESLTIDEAEKKLQQLDKCLRIVKFKFLTHHTVWPFLGLILFLAALPIMDMFSYSFSQEHPYVVIAASVLLFFSMWRMFVKRRALFDYLEEGRARYKLIRKKYNRLYVEKMLGIPTNCL